MPIEPISVLSSTCRPFDATTVAEHLLAWLRTSPDHLIGTLRDLCKTDSEHAVQWESLPHDVRRRVGQVFYRLIHEQPRGQGEAHIRCCNLPGGPTNVHAIYEVTPVSRLA